MVASSFPGGTHGWNYQELIFAGFETWAWTFAVLATSLFFFGKKLVPVLPKTRCQFRKKADKEGNSQEKFTPLLTAELHADSLNNEDILLGQDDDKGSIIEVSKPPPPKLLKEPKQWLWMHGAAITLGALFGVAFAIYLFLSVTSMSDTTWWAMIGVAIFVWLVLAVPLYMFPDSRFSALMLYSMPGTVAVYVHIAIMQFTIWDISSLPGLVGVFAFIPLFVGACYYVTIEGLRHGSNNPAYSQICVMFKTPGLSCWFGARWAALKFAIRRRPKTFILLQLFLIFWTVMMCLSLASGCLALYNTRLPAGSHAMELFSFSTWLTRQTLSSACPENGGAPCHVYLSVPFNLSSSMLVSAQTAVGVPALSVSFVGVSLPNVPMVRYSVSGLEYLGQREVHSALLSELEPDSTYTIQIVYGTAGSATYPRQYKFRTGPAGESPFNFTSGGDVGNTHEASRITSAAAGMEPLFAMVGGDVAYGNAFRSCYRCWDLWLEDWEERMVTPQGYTIPIVMNIGNHDAGTNTMDEAFKDIYPFKEDDVAMPLIMYFFPQVNESTNELLAPHQRPSYHAHIVGTSTIFLSLDSGYFVPYGGTQAQWIDNMYTEYASIPIKLALYHVPIFPMDVSVAGSGDPNDRAVPDGFDFWIPLFDKHKVTLAFENHVHTYKRSYPLVAGTCVPDVSTYKCSESAIGTVFLGDGYWGITQGMGFTPQDVLLIDPDPIIRKAGIRYHVWFIEIDGTSQLTVNAVAGVPCPELEHQICTGIFDTANVTIAPL